MNGLISDLVAKFAIFFLYIFVDPAAKVPAIVLRKRAIQDRLLKTAATLALFQSYADLRGIIETAITSRYGRTPYRILQDMYTKAGGQSSGIVRGIGEINKDGYDPENPGTKNTETGGVNTTVWKDIRGIIAELTDFIKFLKGSSSDKNGAPGEGDWDGAVNPQGNGQQKYSGSFDFNAYLPWIAVAGIGLFLLKSRK